MEILNNLASTVGWLIFIYLGGAGVYELLGGRRYRAALLLAGSFVFIILSLVYFRYTGSSTIRVAFILVYFVACFFLVRKVRASVGTPDFR